MADDISGFNPLDLERHIQETLTGEFDLRSDDEIAWEVAERDIAKGKQPPEYAREGWQRWRTSQKDGIAESFGKGFASEWEGTKAAWKGGVALGLRQLGGKETPVYEQLLMSSERNLDKAAELKPFIGSFGDVRELGDYLPLFANFLGGAVEGVGEAAGSALLGMGVGFVTGNAPGAVVGGIGGAGSAFVGKQSAKKVLKKEIEDLVQDQVDRDSLLKKVDNVFDNNTVSESFNLLADDLIAVGYDASRTDIIKELTTKTTQQTMASLGKTALIGESFVQNSGELFVDLVSRGQDTDLSALTATGTGAINAFLDTFFETKVIDKMFGESADTARKLAKGKVLGAVDAVPDSWWKQGNVVKNLSKGFGVEGTTEAMQEAVNMAGIEIADPNAITPPNAVAVTLLDAFVAGGMGGGLFGGINSYFEYRDYLELQDHATMAGELVKQLDRTFLEQQEAEGREQGKGRATSVLAARPGGTQVQATPGFGPRSEEMRFSLADRLTEQEGEFVIRNDKLVPDDGGAGLLYSGRVFKFTTQSGTDVLITEDQANSLVRFTDNPERLAVATGRTKEGPDGETYTQIKEGATNRWIRSDDLERYSLDRDDGMPNKGMTRAQYERRRAQLVDMVDAFVEDSEEFLGTNIQAQLKKGSEVYNEAFKQAFGEARDARAARAVNRANSAAAKVRVEQVGEDNSKKKPTQAEQEEITAAAEEAITALMESEGGSLGIAEQEDRAPWVQMVADSLLYQLRNTLKTFGLGGGQPGAAIKELDVREGTKKEQSAQYKRAERTLLEKDAPDYYDVKTGETPTNINQKWVRREVVDNAVAQVVKNYQDAPAVEGGIVLQSVEGYSSLPGFAKKKVAEELGVDPRARTRREKDPPKPEKPPGRGDRPKGGKGTTLDKTPLEKAKEAFQEGEVKFTEEELVEGDDLVDAIGAPQTFTQGDIEGSIVDPGSRIRDRAGPDEESDALDKRILDARRAAYRRLVDKAPEVKEVIKNKLQRDNRFEEGEEFTPGRLLSVKIPGADVTHYLVGTSTGEAIWIIVNSENKVVGGLDVKRRAGQDYKTLFAQLINEQANLPRSRIFGAGFSPVGEGEKYSSIVEALASTDASGQPNFQTRSGWRMLYAVVEGTINGVAQVVFLPLRTASTSKERRLAAEKEGKTLPLRTYNIATPGRRRLTYEKIGKTNHPRGDLADLELAKAMEETGYMVLPAEEGDIILENIKPLGIAAGRGDIDKEDIRIKVANPDTKESFGEYEQRGAESGLRSASGLEGENLHSVFDKPGEASLLPNDAEDKTGGINLVEAGEWGKIFDRLGIKDPDMRAALDANLTTLKPALKDFPNVFDALLSDRLEEVASDPLSLKNFAQGVDVWAKQKGLVGGLPMTSVIGSLLYSRETQVDPKTLTTTFIPFLKKVASLSQDAIYDTLTAAMDPSTGALALEVDTDTRGSEDVLDDAISLDDVDVELLSRGTVTSKGPLHHKGVRGRVAQLERALKLPPGSIVVKELPDGVEGAYNREERKIYINANLDYDGDTDRVAKVIFHELSHRGLAYMFSRNPKAYGQFLSLMRSFEKTSMPELDKIAKKYKGKKYSELDAWEKTLVAEELMALKAETWNSDDGADQTIWKKIAGAFQQIMKTLSLNPKLTWTDREVADFVRRAVYQGTKSPLKGKVPERKKDESLEDWLARATEAMRKAREEIENKKTRAAFYDNGIGPNKGSFVQKFDDRALRNSSKIVGNALNGKGNLTVAQAVKQVVTSSQEAMERMDLSEDSDDFRFSINPQKNPKVSRFKLDEPTAYFMHWMLGAKGRKRGTLSFVDLTAPEVVRGGLDEILQKDPEGAKEHYAQAERHLDRFLLELDPSSGAFTYRTLIKKEWVEEAEGILSKVLPFSDAGRNLGWTPNFDIYKLPPYYRLEDLLTQDADTAREVWGRYQIKPKAKRPISPRSQWASILYSPARSDGHLILIPEGEGPRDLRTLLPEIPRKLRTASIYPLPPLQSWEGYGPILPALAELLLQWGKSGVDDSNGWVFYLLEERGGGLITAGNNAEADSWGGWDSPASQFSEYLQDFRFHFPEPPESLEQAKEWLVSDGLPLEWAKVDTPAVRYAVQRARKISQISLAALSLESYPYEASTSALATVQRAIFHGEESANRAEQTFPGVAEFKVKGGRGRAIIERRLAKAAFDILGDPSTALTTEAVDKYVEGHRRALEANSGPPDLRQLYKNAKTAPIPVESVEFKREVVPKSSRQPLPEYWFFAEFRSVGLEDSPLQGLVGLKEGDKFTVGGIQLTVAGTDSYGRWTDKFGRSLQELRAIAQPDGSVLHTIRITQLPWDTTPLGSTSIQIDPLNKIKSDFAQMIRRRQIEGLEKLSAGLKKFANENAPVGRQQRLEDLLVDQRKLLFAAAFMQGQRDYMGKDFIGLPESVYGLEEVLKKIFDRFVNPPPPQEGGGYRSAQAMLKDFMKERMAWADARIPESTPGKKGGYWKILPMASSRSDLPDEEVYALWRGLSNPEWCTSRGNEELYSRNGEMAVYRKDGQSWVALRFDGTVAEGDLQEVQDFRNKASLLPDFLEEVEHYGEVMGITESLDRWLQETRVAARVEKIEEMAAPGAVMTNNVLELEDGTVFIDAPVTIRVRVSDGKTLIHRTDNIALGKEADVYAALRQGRASYIKVVRSKSWRSQPYLPGTYEEVDLSSVREVLGDISLEGKESGWRGLPVVDMPNLEEVGGTAQLHSAPMLKRVGGSAEFTQPYGAPGLESVGGSLEGLEFAPSLKEVGGSLVHTKAPALEKVGGVLIPANDGEYPALTEVGMIQMDAYTVAPNLQQASVIRLILPLPDKMKEGAKTWDDLSEEEWQKIIRGEPGPTPSPLRITLPSLVRVGGIEASSDLVELYAPVLEKAYDIPPISVDLPSLREVEDTLRIDPLYSNVPALETVGTLEVYGDWDRAAVQKLDYSPFPNLISAQFVTAPEGMIPDGVIKPQLRPPQQPPVLLKFSIGDPRNNPKFAWAYAGVKDAETVTWEDIADDELLGIEDENGFDEDGWAFSLADTIDVENPGTEFTQGASSAPTQETHSQQILETLKRVEYEGYSRVDSAIQEVVGNLRRNGNPDDLGEVEKFAQASGRGIANFASHDHQGNPINIDRTASIEEIEGEHSRTLLRVQVNKLTDLHQLLTDQYKKLTNRSDFPTEPTQRLIPINNALAAVNSKITALQDELRRGEYIAGPDNDFGELFQIPQEGDTDEQFGQEDRQVRLGPNTTKAEYEGAILALEDFLNERRGLGGTGSLAYSRALTQQRYLVKARAAGFDDNFTVAQLGAISIGMMGEAETFGLSNTPEGKEISKLLKRYNSEQNKVWLSLYPAVAKAERSVAGAMRRLGIDREEALHILRVGMGVYEQKTTLAESMMDPKEFAGRRARLVLNALQAAGAADKLLSKGEIRALATIHDMVAAQRTVSRILIEGNTEQGLYVEDADIFLEQDKEGKWVRTVQTRAPTDVGAWTFSRRMSGAFAALVRPRNRKENPVLADASKIHDLITKPVTDFGEQQDYEAALEVLLANPELLEIFRISTGLGSKVYRSLVAGPDQKKRLTPILSLPEATDPGSFFQTLSDQYGGHPANYLKQLIQFVNQGKQAVLMEDGIVDPKHVDANKGDPSRRRDTLQEPLLVGGIMSHARSLRDWPQEANEYNIITSLKDLEVYTTSIAAFRAWGRGGNALTAALTKFKGRALDAADELEVLGVPIRERNLKRFLKDPTIREAARRRWGEGGEKKLKSLLAMVGYRNLPDETVRNLNTFFKRHNVGLEDTGRGRSFLKWLINGMLQNPGSAITIMNEAFPFFNEGFDKYSRGKTSDTFKYLVQEALFKPFAIMFGVNPDKDPNLQEFEDTVGFGLDPASERTLSDILAPVTSSRGPIPGEAFDRMVELLQKPIRSANGQAGMRLAAPFTHIVEALRRAILLSNFSSFNRQVTEIIKYYKDGGDSQYPPGFANGPVRQEFLNRFAEVTGMELSLYAKKAMANEKAGRPMFDKDMWMGMLDWAVFQQGDSHIGNLPIGLMHSHSGVLSILYKWSILRGNELNRKRITSQQEEKALVAMGMKFLFMIAPSIAGGMAVNWLRELYMEKLLQKRRNARQLGEMFKGGADDMFLGILEQTASAGVLGYWGDLLDTTTNLASGEGTSRGLSVDSRVVVFSQAQALMNALRFMVNSQDIDYTHVARPVLNAVGGASMIQSLHLVDRLGFELFDWEQNTARRGNVANTLSTWGKLLDYENKVFYGGVKPTKMSAELTALEFAIYEDNPDDFKAAWKRAVDEAVRVGKARTFPEAKDYVRKSLQARHPLRKSFQKITRKQNREMLEAMDSVSRRTTEDAVSKWNRQLRAVGGSAFEGTK